MGGFRTSTGVRAGVADAPAWDRIGTDGGQVRVQQRVQKASSGVARVGLGGEGRWCFRRARGSKLDFTRLRVALIALLANALPMPAVAQWATARITRELNTREREYFGRPLAQVARSLNEHSIKKTGSPCQLSRRLNQRSPAEASPDLSRPESLVGRDGSSTHGLVFPNDWRLELNCPTLGEGYIALGVAPLVDSPGAFAQDAIPSGVPTEGLSYYLPIPTVERRPRALFLEKRRDTSAVVIAFVGDIVNDGASTEPPRAGLARPRIAEIFFVGGPRVDLKGALDLPSTLAALRLAPPPPTTAVAAADTHEPADEAAIYSLLIDRERGVGMAPLVLRETIEDRQEDTYAKKMLGLFASDFPISILGSYRDRNKAPRPFPADLPRVPRARMVEWASEGRGYRESVDLGNALAFSAVGFDADRSHAIALVCEVPAQVRPHEEGLVEAPRYCRRHYLLKRNSEGWGIVYRVAAFHN